MRTLERLSGIRGINWYIGLLGTGLSLTFTFLIYPALVDSQHAVLDPDLHGPLAFGIWKLHAFSYYPNSDPSAVRGPLYPVLMAGLLAASHGWWPNSVQLAQCILFGLMCVLVFWTAKTLWNAPLAVLAAGLCALDPFLIWYTSRIWVEPLMMFLFTALVASVVAVKRRPTPQAALLVGVVIGLSIMVKSVYTPFLVLTPLLLLLPFGTRLKPTLAAIVLIAGLLVIAPWTIRNGRLTGIYSPEIGNSGFTLHQGNDFVEDFDKAPFSILALYAFSLARMREEADLVTFAPGMSEMQRRNALDAARRRTAIDKLAGSPGFFAKKIVYDVFLFWTFGDSASKSLVISLFQLPVVALFGTFIVARRRELAQGAVGICVALIVLFYFAHLPTIALARYSAVLVPGMLAAGVGLWAPQAPRADPRNG